MIPGITGLRLSTRNRKEAFMALVLECSYSKKLGLPQYSSHQYSVSLKVEVADLTKVESASQEVHAILQSSVDREIQKVGFLPEGNGNRNGQVRPSGNGNGHARPEGWNCSDKQRTLIEDIVAEKRLDKNAVEQLATERFGKGVKALNKLEASGLIEELFERHGRLGQRQNQPGRSR
jgi:hypothetical protein